MYRYLPKIIGKSTDPAAWTAGRGNHTGETVQLNKNDKKYVCTTAGKYPFHAEHIETDSNEGKSDIREVFAEKHTSVWKNVIVIYGISYYQKLLFLVLKTGYLYAHLCT